MLKKLFLNVTEYGNIYKQGDIHNYAMKFKKTKKGNTIVPIIRGHLVIPITNKKYELFSDYEVELTKKDFEKRRGKWNDTFQKLYKGRLSKYELMLLSFELPDVIYRKFKKEEPKLFRQTDFMKVCMVNIFKDYPKRGKITINVNIDLLREYKNKS